MLQCQTKNKMQHQPQSKSLIIAIKNSYQIMEVFLSEPNNENVKIFLLFQNYSSSTYWSVILEHFIR